MKQISFFGRSSVSAAFALTNGRPSADRRVRYGMYSDSGSSAIRRRSVGDPSGIRRERSVFGPWSKWCRIAAVGLLLLTLGVGQVWGETITYTISSKNTLTTSGTAPKGSSASIAETYSTSRQMTGGNSQTLTLSGWGAASISNITLSMKSNSSKGAGRLKFSTDGGTSYTYIIPSSGTDGVNFNNAEWHGSWSTSYIDISKDVTITGVSGKNIVIVIEATANSLYCESYKITYTTSSTPSYTITASCNNDSYGTVSLSGTVITGNPKSGYQYADPAYSVSPDNSATVSQDGDAFTVTASANTTVTINFEPIPQYTLNYHDGSGNGSRSNVYEGTNLITALGTPAASCDATSTTFVGWATSEIAAKTNTAPTFVAADAVVNATTAAATYYAVYAKAGSAGTPVNVFSVNVQCINENISLSGYSKMIGTEWSNPNRQDGNSNNPAYIGFYRATKLFSSVPTTITATAYLAGGTAKNPLSNSVYAVFLDASGNEIAGSETVLCSDVSTTYEEKTASMPTAYAANAYGLKIRHAKETGFNVRYQSISLSYTNITYTHYMTTCCESLGEIKGSVDSTQ